MIMIDSAVSVAESWDSVSYLEGLPSLIAGFECELKYFQIHLVAAAALLSCLQDLRGPFQTLQKQELF